MLEACVDRRTGEVIAVKPKGQPWSDAERDGPVLVVVKLNDPDLKLRNTVRAYPYAVYEKNPNGSDLDAAMTEISRWKIDKRKLKPLKQFKRANLKEKLSDYKE